MLQITLNSALLKPVSWFNWSYTGKQTVANAEALSLRFKTCSDA
uniref:Uncharacterized protein n=1 Tax=Anguilla anguilla TaxID=7936 RepID=A0A0E9V1N9_ANGAN